MSWPGYKAQVESGTQNYIQKCVRVNDLLNLEYRSYYTNGKLDHSFYLRHNGKRIAKLSKKKGDKILNGNFQNSYCSLRVSQIYRHRLKSSDFEGKTYSETWDRIGDDLKRQGWLYTVIVSGRIGEL